MEEKDILPLRRYSIRGVPFWVPHDGEAFLRRRYGDFMQLPPVEQRVGHFTSVKFL
jgi:lipopolysaccharide cholinephosphotransferase